MSNATIELLDRLAAKMGDASDYRIAAELGVGKATVSKWRVGKGTMGEDNALKIAELLDEDPKFILTCVLAERSKSKKAKQVLKQIADNYKRSIATIAALAVLFSFYNLDTYPRSPADAAVYIMRSS